jgi:hypothetical protein
MGPVYVECGCCRGAGRVELSQVYAATLAFLRATPGRTGATLARLYGCSNEAMCNRLRRLERHGLAAGTRDGKAVRWRATDAEGDA